MNVISRGIRNAFRNYIRTFSLVIIIGLSIGLALTMLVARQAVSSKIASVKASVGTTITISPAGVRGFSGGGNALTQTQLSKVSGLAHVTELNESLEDRLTTSDTNLVSAITAGSLGQRFAGNSGSGTSPSTDSTGSSPGSFGGGSFTPPVTVTGSTDPTDLSNSMGGGTFKLTGGTVFNTGSTANVAVVGSSLASKNSLKVGSTFTAYSQTITVVGIFDAGNTFSNNQILMPLATVQSLSSQTGDVTNATVTVDSVSNVGSVTSAISKQLGSAADVTNEAEQVQDSVASLENIRTITLYSLIGAVVAGAAIILLTMVMIVRERRREIGVLKAIGASNSTVMWQFMTEAVTLTVLGAIIGIALGVAAASPITKLLVSNSTGSSSQTAGGFQGRPQLQAGNDSTSATAAQPSNFRPQITRGQFRGVRNSIGNIHAVVGWSIIVYGFLAAIVIAVVGSAAASFVIAKIKPAEVMRAE